MGVDKIGGVLILLIIVAGFVFLVWNFFLLGDEDVAEKCVDVNRAAGFVYDLCYDSLSDSVFMLVERKLDEYRLNFFEISFFDTEKRRYELWYNYVNNSQLYKFYASQNPLVIDIRLDVIKDFSEPICVGTRRLPVRDCSTMSPGQGRGFVNGSGVENYIELEPSMEEEWVKDINFSEEVVIVEGVLCETDWKCSEWESCQDGFQRRNCRDENNCSSFVGSPSRVRYCDGNCIESWECSWSECIDGMTTPSCVDRSGCGTEYNLPSMSSCEFEQPCYPNIVCSVWSECDFGYNLFDFNENNIESFAGTKSRICRDVNSCVEPIEEVRACSNVVDVYSEVFEECGKEYVGIYNELNDELIAKIDRGADGESVMNIYFDEGGDVWCDYCFNGVMDEDEIGVDCGGSCELCDEKYKESDFKKEGWFSRFVNWVGDLF